MLVVLYNQIRPPIKIQNRRNKQTYNTYAFTIDIVPLVLERQHFAEHIFEYKWKTRQKAQSGKA
jgi:chorismate mutase